MTLDVDPVTVDGRWWRHTPAGIDPARRPDPPVDSRWQRGDIVDALYLVGDEAGVWAEWYRYLAEAAIPPLVGLPRDLWHYEVAPIEVSDLSSSDRLARVGLRPPRPERGGWPAFQAVGEELADQGWRGVLTSSAARVASLVLVVFLPERTIPAELNAVSCRHVVAPPPPPTGMTT